MLAQTLPWNPSPSVKLSDQRPSVPSIADRPKALILSEMAFNKLMEILHRYGNKPSEKQKEALYKLVHAYTQMADGYLTGRYAFPLATGLGKTQSIVAWLSTKYQLAQQGLYSQNVSIAVCASKVEALCDLKRDLIEAGVPEDQIGLFHSYRFDEEKAKDYLKNGSDLPKGYASLPCTDEHQEKNILLVTHNRVRGKGGMDQFNLYKGRPRDLLIWDESLFISDARAISEVELKSGIGWLKPKVGDGKTQEALDYLDQCIEIFEKEMEEQKDLGRQPGLIRLPALTSNQVTEYKKALGDSPVISELKALLEICQNELRVVNTDQRGAFIHYEIVVPSELRNIIILDASHNIRELVKMDKTIKTYQIPTEIVSYENVTVHQLEHFSGRHTMHREFSKKKSRLRREITETIKKIPEDEAILLFTFKERYLPWKVDFKKILQQDLESEGIDLDATVMVPVWRNGEWTEEEKPRFVILTWGNETSLSRHSYCSNVVFAGVLHRSHVDLASAIIGQKDDLLMKIPNSMIYKVLNSEIAHSLYQAMSRGSCRVIEGSMTKAMKVWLIHKDSQKDSSIQRLLKEVMPGLKWMDWESKYVVPSSKVKEIAEKIAQYLQGLQQDRVSTSKIKKALNLKDIPNMTFTRAIKELSKMETGWVLDGRSLISPKG